jgi:type IV secretion system protein TrbL
MLMLPTRYRCFVQLLLLLVISMLSTSVLAADGHGSLVSTLVDKFQQGQATDVIGNAAKSLFWSLATMSLVWNFGVLLLRRADFGELFLELISFIVFTGLFYWLLTNATAASGFVYAIVDSFQQMGPDSVSDLRQPADNIVQIGLNIFYRVLDQSKNWPDGDLLLVGGMTLLIVIALTLVVAQIALVLIMAWMLAYGGIFLLGFGGARWTSLIAISYYKHVLAVGVALLSLILLVAMGQGFLVALSSELTDGSAIQYSSLADMLVVSLIMTVLSFKVPSLLYTLVTNSQLGLLAGTASMAGNAIASGGKEAYRTASHIVNHYRSYELGDRYEAEKSSVRGRHETVIDALRSAAAYSTMDAVYKPVEVVGHGTSHIDNESYMAGKSSAFPSSATQGAWPGLRPEQASPAAQQAASGGRVDSENKGASLQGGSAATAEKGGGIAALQERVLSAAAQGGGASMAAYRSSDTHNALGMPSGGSMPAGGFLPGTVERGSTASATVMGASANATAATMSGSMASGAFQPSALAGTAISGATASGANVSGGASHGGFQPLALGGTPTSGVAAAATNVSNNVSSSAAPPSVVAGSPAKSGGSGGAPNLSGGISSGNTESGKVGKAVSGTTVLSQEGPSLGGAPRQPAGKSRTGRKVDDTTGPVGRRDKQQERALQQQKKRPERESVKGDSKAKVGGVKPRPATENRSSAPSDDEVKAFRDRQTDTTED